MLATLLLCVSLVPAQADRVSVYVSAPMRGGFADTNKDTEDSIKDVRDRLSGMKEFVVVDSRQNADIILTVVTRGVGSATFGQRLSYSQYYKGADLTSTPIVANTFWVTTMMQVGEYRKEFVGAHTQESQYSVGAWTECAKQVADNLKSWALANAEQLRQRRRIRQP
jgi:hypothetical protein